MKVNLFDFVDEMVIRLLSCGAMTEGWPMGKPDPFHKRAHLVLSLLVLVANVIAPFRTSSGRALIDAYGHPLLHQSHGRFRAHFETIPSHCFRAVVGLSRGELASALPTPLAPVLIGVSSSPVPVCAVPFFLPAPLPFCCPLRC